MIPHFHPRRILRRLTEFFRGGKLDPFPILHTLRKYSREKFRADGKAALNVSLLDIPQGIAYAAIAELPIVFGIACSATASLIAPLFAGSRHTILGPTNATAFMLFGFFAMEPMLATRASSRNRSACPNTPASAPRPPSCGWRTCSNIVPAPCW